MPARPAGGDKAAGSSRPQVTEREVADSHTPQPANVADEPSEDHPPSETGEGGSSGQAQAPQQADQRQATPPARIPEGRPAPEDWTPPGDHIKGFYPGDPNVYPDPENPQRSY
jgi:hypothetical protein